MHAREDFEKLTTWLAISKSMGWWSAFEGIVFCCERPEKQIVNSAGVLHCENGPAILCREGWPVWALNGVQMKEDQIMTPSERMDPRIILSEQNVDVRRELLRKIGIERFMQVSQTKKLHAMGDYELLAIDLSSELPQRRFLKMLNPSLGIWHVEGVPQECETVQHALNSRKPAPLRAIPIDQENGEDWYLQGDVAIWPREAKKVKEFPLQIT
jgi:hypothetical protein